jgi:hypothetical protein
MGLSNEKAPEGASSGAKANPLDDDDPVNRPEHTTANDSRKQAANAAERLLPAFQFSVLTCAKNLLATKTIFADGTVVPYGNPKHFRYRYCEIHSLEEFAKALGWLADQPHNFIIRGQLKEGLTGWQRRLLKPNKDDPTTIECPPRRWIVFDFDGVEVEYGMGNPDSVEQAGYFIRDRRLPPEFQFVRCVASVTSSTGRKGPSTAHLRLFFMLAQPEDNDALEAWVESIAQRHPGLKLDPSVIRAQQLIFTARPLFRGCRDPVPVGCLVRVLSGDTDCVAHEPYEHKPKRKRKYEPQAGPVVCDDMPAWMVEMVRTGRASRGSARESK